MDDQNERVKIMALHDDAGILYWFRRIETSVCLSGECKLVDVGLYWYCTGAFFALEVYGEHLTKTDHSTFSYEDYNKLISILNDDWASLREYDFSELLNNNDEGVADITSGAVDGASGATKKEIASEAVSDAVYTTYTLWHLTHNGEKEQLEQLTADQLNRRNDLQGNLIDHDEERYKYFLLELLALGKLNVPSRLNNLIIEGMTSSNAMYKNLAVKALARADINDSDFQSQIAEIYDDFSTSEKLPILSVLKDLKILNTDFYNALARDLSLKNERFSIKILDLIKISSSHSDKVIEIARHFTESENLYIRNSAIEFLQNRR